MFTVKGLFSRWLTAADARVQGDLQSSFVMHGDFLAANFSPFREALTRVERNAANTRAPAQTPQNS
ncbi:hypothetical protein [Bradyrhizobium iriomotense]|uniref:hypothetical protein n=1 Tax=Bradyrhizobium iriomotense TaxID=441950 RepID=UPI0024E0AEA4|nr:hypothetical protein [Bradyrhizobium iriomotense]